jgi:hypothetical protein
MGYCSLVQETIPMTAQENLELGPTVTPPLATAKRLEWTRLGLRMGYTRNSAQRMEILDAIERMAWIDMVAGTSCLAGPVARAMARSVLRDRRGRPQQLGVADLVGGHRLIGLDDNRGARLFVLDLDVEAIVLLAEIDACHTARRPSTP